ncbi:Sir2 family NAD-dependent protein deacetylase [Streptomyces sp. NPDC048420]|uniref:Sir2 family NAD-dependent protein deacetylase n=1 Tax=Streptomyces sp. NPDC048420 TaxID=3155755 RepID=UPI003431D669
MSTESGIPDYRGEGGSLNRHTPVLYQDFTGSARARRRYWAQSPRLACLRSSPAQRGAPGDGRFRHGLLSGVITQNVDGLHQAAAPAEHLRPPARALSLCARRLRVRYHRRAAPGCRFTN